MMIASYMYSNEYNSQAPVQMQMKPTVQTHRPPDPTKLAPHYAAVGYTHAPETPRRGRHDCHETARGAVHVTDEMGVVAAHVHARTHVRASELRKRRRCAGGNTPHTRASVVRLGAGAVITSLHWPLLYEG